LQDNSLIQGCKANDRKAQFEFYQKYFAFVSGICLRYLSSAATAREVTNDVFLKLFTKIALFDAARGSIMAWIKTIAVNTCLDKLKLTSFEQFHTELEEKHEAFADAVPEERLTTADLLLFLQKLPEKQSVIFNLFVVEGYSHDEIAAMLHISSGNSRWYVSDAKQRLKKLITASGYLVK
jgi:RNA polymerase sigma-70 factor (ECF subfamily)